MKPCRSHEWQGFIYFLKTYSLEKVLPLANCPLDFEEFLWANGINKKVIDSVKSCFVFS